MISEAVSPEIEDRTDGSMNGTGSKEYGFFPENQNKERKYLP
jgi:hypothetical protein